MTNIDKLFESEEPALTIKGTVRKRKPKQANNFFTQDTENAIISYIASTDQEERNKLFQSRIYYSFYKLSEILIHNFKFYYTEVDNLEDLKHEIVCMLMDKLTKYSKEKGKAYSYYYKIAFNYLSNYNKVNYKKRVAKSEVYEVDNDKSITIQLINEQTQQTDLVAFLDLYITYIDNNLVKLFPKLKEQKIADAILELFKKRENLDILNKKTYYIYIREITDAPTAIITNVTNKLKKIYKKGFSIYLEEGLDSNIFE